MPKSITNDTLRLNIYLEKELGQIQITIDDNIHISRQNTKKVKKALIKWFKMAAKTIEGWK